MFVRNHKNFFINVITLCSFRAVTEYGKIVQGRTTTERLDFSSQRWIRTLQFQTTDIDGNPNQPRNGGIAGLANSHCVGSLINHSRDYAKCMYWPRDHNSSRLESNDATNLLGCIFIRSNRKIYRHEQLLINYEPNTAARIQNMLYFV